VVENFKNETGPIFSILKKLPGLNISDTYLVKTTKICCWLNTSPAAAVQLQLSNIKVLTWLINSKQINY